MNREDIIAMAREAGDVLNKEWLERFAKLVAQAERNKVAQWMIRHSYATGHGDTVEDLLKELVWQVAEAERESLAAEAERNGNSILAMQLRARGQA